MLISTAGENRTTTSNNPSRILKSLEPGYQERQGNCFVCMGRNATRVALYHWLPSREKDTNPTPTPTFKPLGFRGGLSAGRVPSLQRPRALLTGARSKAAVVLSEVQALYHRRFVPPLLADRRLGENSEGALARRDFASTEARAVRTRACLPTPAPRPHLPKSYPI